MLMLGHARQVPICYCWIVVVLGYFVDHVGLVIM